MIKLAPDPEDKVVSSLLHPVHFKEEEPKLRFFFFHQVSTECHADSCICWSPLELLYFHKDHSQNWSAFTHEGTRWVILPAREHTLPQESLFLTHFNPRTPTPTNSHLQQMQSPKLPPPCTVSLVSVLFAGKQLQGQDLWARATHISVSAWLSLGHPSDHAGVAPYWGKQVLAMSADGISWSQRWSWVSS